MGDNYNEELEEVFKKQSFDKITEEQKEHLRELLKDSLKAKKEEPITIIPTDNYKPYIITNLDNKYSRAVMLTEKQSKAINWFIDEFGIEDYVCESVEDTEWERVE